MGFQNPEENDLNAKVVRKPSLLTITKKFDQIDTTPCLNHGY